MEQIVAKLRRTKRDLTPDGRRRFEDAAGMAPDALAAFLTARPAEEAVA